MKYPTRNESRFGRKWQNDGRRKMTVAELKEKLDSYFERCYGECELKTIDKGGNTGEVLSVYTYSDQNSVKDSVVVIEVT